MKVQDLAKELGHSPKNFIQFLNNKNIRVKSGNTKLNPTQITQIRNILQHEARKNAAKEEVLPEREVKIPGQNLTVKQLAAILEVPLTEIMKVTLQKGLLLTLNSEIDIQTAADISEKMSIILDVQSQDQTKEMKGQIDKIEEDAIFDDMDNLVDRAPVITIMGHVDHGKTLLLDTIRKSNIISSESGGITQHIGAYQITFQDKPLTFLDTPGHAAFTALRARGAHVTDMVILVVAADEGLKPQTLEALDHAKSAKVPILVAINKMDKPEANIDQCKQQLAEKDLVAEDWGGKTVCVPISAKKGTGIDDLLEMVLLQAEILELKANPEGLAKGIVIESHLSRTKGPVASILVKTGTMKVTDYFVVEGTTGKVRALLNDRGEKIVKANPGMPVEILGLSEVPTPGALLEVCETEKECKKKAEKVNQAGGDGLKSKQAKSTSLEKLSKQSKEGEQALNLILKTDVNGSLEAIVTSLEQMNSEDIMINVIHSATGPINENDIMLAVASNAMLIAYNVPIQNEASKLAAREKIAIKSYKIIYNILDDIQAALTGLFRPEYEDIEVGEVEIRDVFSFSKLGKIAGCYVTEGKVNRSSQIRLMREEEEIFSGKISSLKRFKEDVKEVASGYECGIVLSHFNDFKVGDKIVCFETKQK